MRRLVLLVSVVLVVSVLFAGAAFGIVRFGGNGPDTLVGTGQADKLFGGKGPDEIRGRGGNDKLRGGEGPDVCIGGRGRDSFRSCETLEQ